MGMIIAIDGPAGSGKGTVAKILSQKCGFINIDTGATYRALALACLNNNIKIEEESKIIDLAKKINIKQDKDGNVFLDGKDVTLDIRSKDVTMIVSFISSIEKVREIMVDLQRKMASDNDVVMEGRDITTVVFPDADYKFYLDATLEERANRRFIQNQEKNIEMSKEEIIDNIAKRDYNDKHKKVGALKIALDAIYIDSTNMTIDEVVNKMLDVIGVKR